MTVGMTPAQGWAINHAGDDAMKKFHTNIRVDDDLIERIDADASRQDRSRAWIIVKILRAHYERVEGSQTAPQGRDPKRVPRRRS